MPINKLPATRINKNHRRTTQGSCRNSSHPTHKKTVAIIFGGPSVEHEVSIWSAKNIFQSCIELGHTAVLIYVDQSGVWKTSKNYGKLFENTENNKLFSVISEAPALLISISPSKGFLVKEKKILVNVAFPIIHGTMGEDGQIQGLLEILKLPYVGCGILSSALCMNKAATKQIAEYINIPVAKYISATASTAPTFEKVKQRLGLPCFVKPTSLGSSVGVTKVRTKQEYADALTLVFSVDNAALIEEAIIGREVECSILSDSDLRISNVGEVATTHDFYSFDAKYLDESHVKISVPANIPAKIRKQIQSYTKAIATACHVQGLGRIDFFYREKENDIIFNEINTLPGFTAMSMYPRLWETEGYSQARLIDRLLEHAFCRNAEKK